MKEKKFQWFQITGYSTLHAEGEANLQFRYFIEAESPHEIVKWYGGRHKCVSNEGQMVIANFPSKESAIVRMPTTWRPAEVSPQQYKADNAVIERIIPATRYHCQCGKIHISTRPYPSMWCSCGRKAFPARPQTEIAHQGNQPTEI